MNYGLKLKNGSTLCVLKCPITFRYGFIFNGLKAEMMNNKIINLINEMYEAIGEDRHVVAYDTYKMRNKIKDLHKLVKNLTIPVVVGRSEKFICPCCGSDKTYKTEAYHCNRCAVTTEV